jgi:hypothetical protein
MNRAIIAVILFIAALSAHSQDTSANRLIAANRYLKAVPMDQMITETVIELSKQLPAERREEFIRQMNATIQAGHLESIARKAMITHFTTEELNALADFYGSKHGASTMKKFGPYMADVLPSIQAEVQRSLRQLGHVPK